MDFEMNPALYDALQMFQEAVQYFKEQKASRGYFILHVEDGDFNKAIHDTTTPAGTREWFSDLRSTLCRNMY